MFSSAASQGNVTVRAQQICTELRTWLNDVSDFYAWLSAQSDTDLGTGGLGFTAEDLSFLRGSFADMMALRAIAENGLPPASYPQPASAFPYMQNVTQVIGP